MLPQNLNTISYKEVEPKLRMAFLKKCPNRTVEHASLDYFLDHAKDPVNHSFYVQDEKGELLALVPVIVTQNNNSARGEWFGLSLPAVLQVSESTEVLKFCFEESHKLAGKLGLKKISYNLGFQAEEYNPLVRFGFLDSSLLQMVIDLPVPLEEHFSNLSKGHKSVIKKHDTTTSIREMKFSNQGEFTQIMKTISETFTDEYLAFRWWQHTQKMLSVFELVAVGTDEIISRAVFLQDDLGADYLFANRLVEDSSISGHHLILWKAIQHFREIGLQRLRLAVFSYTSQLNYHASQKVTNINLFKRGFGPRITAFHIGECYLDQAYFEEEMLKRVRRLKEE